MPATKTKASTPAKITRPNPGRVLQRVRLFRRFDEGSRHPLIWVAGPPGAGKTTLVSSYLDARKRPCLWYQLRWGENGGTQLTMNTHALIDFNAFYSPLAKGLFFGVVPWRLPAETGVENIACS